MRKHSKIGSCKVLWLSSEGAEVERLVKDKKLWRKARKLFGDLVIWSFWHQVEIKEYDFRELSKIDR